MNRTVNNSVKNSNLDDNVNLGRTQDLDNDWGDWGDWDDDQFWSKGNNRKVLKFKEHKAK
jgi:hypothetical protein